MTSRTPLPTVEELELALEDLYNARRWRGDHAVSMSNCVALTQLPRIAARVDEMQRQSQYDEEACFAFAIRDEVEAVIDDLSDERARKAAPFILRLRDDCEGTSRHHRCTEAGVILECDPKTVHNTVWPRLRDALANHLYRMAFKSISLDAVIERARTPETATDPEILGATMQQPLVRTAQRPQLVLVGGYAGSGKTEVGRFLARTMSWAHLDKNEMFQPLVEELLHARGGDTNDRHTDLYVDGVRPIEYQCLQNVTVENLSNGLSAVVTAPFLKEVTDEPWLRQLGSVCTATGAMLTMVWVEADAETMHSYLRERNASRDAWKLSDWDRYLRTIDIELRPLFPHHLVDNTSQASRPLLAQVDRLAEEVAYG